MFFRCFPHKNIGEKRLPLFDGWELWASDHCQNTKTRTCHVLLTRLLKWHLFLSEQREIKVVISICEPFVQLSKGRLSCRQPSLPVSSMQECIQSRDFHTSQNSLWWIFNDLTISWKWWQQPVLRRITGKYAKSECAVFTSQRMLPPPSGGLLYSSVTRSPQEKANSSRRTTPALLALKVVNCGSCNNFCRTRFSAFHEKTMLQETTESNFVCSHL